MQQSDVRERLREVAQQAFALGVVLLAEEADIVSQRRELLSVALGFFHAPGRRQRTHQPEAADEKCPFTAGKPVHAVLRRVAPDERPLADLLLRIASICQDARVVRRQKAGDRDKQQARIGVPAVVLDERVALGVVAFRPGPRHGSRREWLASGRGGTSSPVASEGT